MTWFKIDDAFWSHPKVIELSAEAGWLWARAGSYCAKHLTDGLVTRGTLRMLGADRDSATELVIAGLWTHDAEQQSWRFHDWLKYQPSREKVLEERAKAAERMRKNRSGNTDPSSTDVRANSDSTFDATSASPSRPVPSRPGDSSTYVSESSHDSNAREATDSVSAFTQQIASQLGITDLAKLRDHIHAKTGITIGAHGAIAVARSLLERAAKWPDHPQRYVMSSITRSTPEVAQFIHEGNLA